VSPHLVPASSWPTMTKGSSSRTCGHGLRFGRLHHSRLPVSLSTEQHAQSSNGQHLQSASGCKRLTHLASGSLAAPLLPDAWRAARPAKAHDGTASSQILTFDYAKHLI
jgi:hypothetical protein